MTRGREGPLHRQGLALFALGGWGPWLLGPLGCLDALGSGAVRGAGVGAHQHTGAAHADGEEDTCGDNQPQRAAVTAGGEQGTGHGLGLRFAWAESRPRTFGGTAAAMPGGNPEETQPLSFGQLRPL